MRCSPVWPTLLLWVLMGVGLPPASPAVLCMLYCPAKGNSPGAKFLPPGPPQCITDITDVVDCAKQFVSVFVDANIDYYYYWKDPEALLDAAGEFKLFADDIANACGFDSKLSLLKDIIVWLFRPPILTSRFETIGVSSPDATYCERFAALQLQVQDAVFSSTRRRVEQSSRNTSNASNTSNTSNTSDATSTSNTSNTTTIYSPVSVVDEAADSSCSCNTIVESILEAFLTPLAEAKIEKVVCTIVVDLAIKLLIKKALPMCFQAKGIAKVICKLIFDVIDAVTSPVQSLVVNLCATILQTLYKVLKLEADLDRLTKRIAEGGDSWVKSAANSFCGLTICVSGSQTTCAPAAAGKGFTSVVDTNKLVGTLCEYLDSKCFPAHATLTLCDGSSIAMSDVVLNRDSIRAVDGTCSPVFFYSSHDPQAAAFFLRFTLSPLDIRSPSDEANISFAVADLNSPQSLYIHPENLLPVYGATLRVARDVRVGDLLLSSVDGNLLRVVRITRERHVGLYHPHLWSLQEYGVDGVRVSQFTTSVHPTVGMAGLYALKGLAAMGAPVNSGRARGAMHLLRQLLPISFIQHGEFSVGWPNTCPVPGGN